MAVCMPKVRRTHHVVDDPDCFSNGTGLETHVFHSIDKFTDCDVSSGIVVKVDAVYRL